MHFCRHCKAELHGREKFCPRCGQKIANKNNFTIEESANEKAETESEIIRDNAEKQPVSSRRMMRLIGAVGMLAILGIVATIIALNNRPNQVEMASSETSTEIFVNESTDLMNENAMKDSEVLIDTLEADEVPEKNELESFRLESFDDYAMDFAEIEQGNYSSLMKGRWKRVAAAVRSVTDGMRGFYWEAVSPNFAEELSVTKDMLSCDLVTLQKKTALNGYEGVPLHYTASVNSLKAATPRDYARLNASAHFIGKGATVDISLKNNFPLNPEKNYIFMWGSSGNHYLLFEQNSPEQERAIEKVFALNMAQIINNDLSSVVGTWVNPMNNQRLVVTETVIENPNKQSRNFLKGQVVADVTQNGFQQVIVVLENQTDKEYPSLVVGGIGYYDYSLSAQFRHLYFLAQGYSRWELDPTDSTRDRIIISDGGDGVDEEITEEVYYWE